MIWVVTIIATLVCLDMAEGWQTTVASHPSIALYEITCLQSFGVLNKMWNLPVLCDISFQSEYFFVCNPIMQSRMLNICLCIKTPDFVQVSETCSFHCLPKGAAILKSDSRGNLGHVKVGSLRIWQNSARFTRWYHKKYSLLFSTI